MVRTEAEGRVVSNPVELPSDRRRLAWVAWNEKPFDPVRGELHVEVRTAPDKYFIDRKPWLPVENGKSAELPLEGFLQWRAVMSTRDPWRTPGFSGVTFGFQRTSPGESAEAGSRRRWLWLFLIIPAAALIAWFLIGRKTWWR
jgi:hypothetical protein